MNPEQYIIESIGILKRTESLKDNLKAILMIHKHQEKWDELECQLVRNSAMHPDAYIKIQDIHIEYVIRFNALTFTELNKYHNLIERT